MKYPGRVQTLSMGFLFILKRQNNVSLAVQKTAAMKTWKQADIITVWNKAGGGSVIEAGSSPMSVSPTG